jgi:hypothetical protein
MQCGYLRVRSSHAGLDTRIGTCTFSKEEPRSVMELYDETGQRLRTVTMPSPPVTLVTSMIDDRSLNKPLLSDVSGYSRVSISS